MQLRMQLLATGGYGAVTKEMRGGSRSLRAR
jgi:hypothetical protein